MKKLLLLFIILCISILISQKKATTEDGKIVILNENGTWQYQKKDIGNLTVENPLGIWKIKYYVDDFGDPTHQGYISTNLEGTFSNSATSNSKLNIIFIIGDKISFQLYEYGGRSEVKGKISTKTYEILLKHNGKKLNNKFKARNWSDRAIMEKIQSEILMDYLKQGGKFQFFVNETGTYSDGEYKFIIDDASGFDNAWEILYGDSD